MPANEKEREPATWYPPHTQMGFFEDVIKIVLPKDYYDAEPKYEYDHLNYFNRKGQWEELSIYDRTFQLQPGFDIKTKRCDRRNLKPIWENIYQQEKHKIIPVTTSKAYGNINLKPLDINSKEYNKRTVTSEFKRRNGLNIPPDIENSKQVL